MADGVILTATMDITKLKVPDLKKELKNRGLNTGGNKQELIDRLTAALNSSEKASNESVDDLEEDLLDEDDDDVHLEATESVISDFDSGLNESINVKTQKRKSDGGETNGDSTVAPPPKKVTLNRNNPIITESKAPTEDKVNTDSSDDVKTEKKVIKLSNITVKERLEMRAKKFDTSLSTEARKIARAERFGIQTNTNNNSVINTNVNTSLDVLKQRAERFGGSVSKVMSNLETKEKLEKRKARFGIVTDTDKAKQRLERFKEPVK